jgi:hypothetical protein
LFDIVGRVISWGSFVVTARWLIFQLRSREKTGAQYRCRRSICHTEITKERRYMDLHGALSEYQRPRNTLVGIPSYEKLEDLLLPRSERR